MPVVVTFEPIRPRSTDGESLSLKVHLANGGAADAAVPNPIAAAPGAPAWEILAPGASDWRKLEWTPPAVGHGRKAPPPPPPVLTVPANGATDAYLPLRDVAVGESRVRARAPAGADYTLATAEVSFKLEALAARGVSLGRSTDPTSQELFGVLLHANESECVVFQTRFQMPHAPGGIPEPAGFSRLATAAANAREPLCPDAAFERAGSMFTWAGWREGRTLCALALGEETPARLELEAEAVVLQATVLKRTLELEVFLVVGAELVLARFQAPRGAAAASGAIAWRAPLPGAFGAGAVAIDAVGEKERRHVALVTPEFEPRVFFATLWDEKPPAKWQERWLEAHAFVPGCRPAIRVSGDRARVATVVRSRVDDRPLVLATAELGLATAPDASVPEVEGPRFTSERLALDKGLEARAALVAFRGATPATVVEAADGTLHVPGRPETRPADPHQPLAIVALSMGTFIARVRRGLVVERL